MNPTPIILASRSPRRRELLSQLVDPSRIHVVPPANSDEPGFEDCQSINDVDRRIREIARAKRIAVRHELRNLASGGRGSRQAVLDAAPPCIALVSGKALAAGPITQLFTGICTGPLEVASSEQASGQKDIPPANHEVDSQGKEDLRSPVQDADLVDHDLTAAAILAADTTIVAESAAGRMEVLGQPPPEDASRPTVRRWFEEFYFARPHVALTAVSIERSDGQVAECVAITTVSFSRARAGWLDWYLATDEPDGKAGGYAVQGLASVFIDRIEGSLTNVVGLPLAETRQLLIDLGLLR